MRLAGVGRWAAPAALVLALASLALNAYLFAQLRRPERWALPAVERALRPLTGDDGVVSYVVRIPAGTPLELDIPVDERFSIAVDTVIPINTTVRIPLDTPLGRRSVNVPVRAALPLRTSLPLHVRHTFRLRTRTTREIEVPIRIRLGDLLDPSRGPS